LLLALLAGGCYAAASAVYRGRYWPHGFVAAWLVVPVVLSFAVSFVQPMFLSRYLIICVPALVLFGTAAIARLRRPVVAWVVVASLVWLSATHLFAFYESGRGGESWRDATGYVLAATRPGDGIVFYPYYVRAPFEYYQRQGKVTGPANLEGQALVGRERIWLVIREPDAADHVAEMHQLRSLLTERYRLVDRRRFPQVGVELYVR